MSDDGTNAGTFNLHANNATSNRNANIGAHYFVINTKHALA